jgi:hypothetical protein
MVPVLAAGMAFPGVMPAGVEMRAQMMKEISCRHQCKS